MFSPPDRSPWRESGVEGGEQRWWLDLPGGVRVSVFAQATPASRYRYRDPALLLEKDRLDPARHATVGRYSLTDWAAATLLACDSAQAATRLAQRLADLERQPHDPSGAAAAPRYRPHLRYGETATP